MIQPAKLLKDFGVSRIVSDDAFVCILSADMLDGIGVYHMIRVVDTGSLRLSVVRTHGRSGTRYRRGRGDWEGFEEYDRSRTTTPRICLAVCK